MRRLSAQNLKVEFSDAPRRANGCDYPRGVVVARAEMRKINRLIPSLSIGHERGKLKALLLSFLRARWPTIPGGWAGQSYLAMLVGDRISSLKTDAYDYFDQQFRRGR